MVMIDKLLWLCEFFELKNYELTSDEKRALSEFYNLAK
jgi:hypothetical protein